MGSKKRARSTPAAADGSSKSMGGAVAPAIVGLIAVCVALAFASGVKVRPEPIMQSASFSGRSTEDLAAQPASPKAAATASSGAHEDTSSAAERPLPQGWASAEDPDSGKTYYYHVESRRSQWEFPTGEPEQLERSMDNHTECTAWASAGGPSSRRTQTWCSNAPS